jgi:hypothetical protein
MLLVYLDESGIHSNASPCVIVAGYFGKKGEWRRFESRWEGVLRRFRVPLDEFHALDAIKRQKFFAPWPEDTHAHFLTALGQAVGQSLIHPISYGIYTEDFFKFSLNQRRFLTSWGVWFSRVDDKSAKPFYGSVLKSDLSELSDEDLRKSLESALVMKALEDPEWDWRTVAGVAEETGLPKGKVRELLESSTSVIRSSVPDNEGRSLYTTRQHYKARRSFLDSLRTAT